MRAPTPGTVAAATEDELLIAHDLQLQDFARAGKLAQGTRRPLAVRVADPAVSATDDDAIEIQFTLPPGSYATAIMRELLKGPTDFPE
jgi:tRNA pseudouridine13 synthase